jgi:hypothetical protein
MQVARTSAMLGVIYPAATPSESVLYGDWLRDPPDLVAALSEQDATIGGPGE